MNGNITVLFTQGKTLAEVWEKSILDVYENGCDIKTEYDKPEDPPSKDCSMTMVVSEPFSEPMIHKDMPGGVEDLQEYVMEVLDGIKDHCVRDSSADESDTRWEYTYHQRLFDYQVPGMEKPFDQIEMIAKKLAETPHSRRSQAITWKVWEDNFCYDKVINCSNYGEQACIDEADCEFTDEVVATCTGDAHCVDINGNTTQDLKEACEDGDNTEWIVCLGEQVEEEFCDGENECQWQIGTESSCKEKEN